MHKQCQILLGTSLKSTLPAIGEYINKTDFKQKIQYKLCLLLPQNSATKMLTYVSKCNENNGTSITKLITHTACF